MHERKSVCCVKHIRKQTLHCHCQHTFDINWAKFMLHDGDKTGRKDTSLQASSHRAFLFLSLSFFAVIRRLECVHCLMCKAQFLIRLTVQQGKKFAVRAPRQRSRSCKKKRCKVWINHFTSLCRVRDTAAGKKQRECAAEIWDNFSSARQVHCGRSTSVDRLRFFTLERILLTDSSFFSHASVRNT